MASVESKVYRLRGIPEHLDRLGVARLVSRFIPDGDQRDVVVASLALSCEIWATPRTKTATLSFKKLPEAVSRDPAAGEWPLPDLALAKPLLLDDAFFGLSPLNDVPEHEHRYDCIVLSGLGSHPMGSWQPHGRDKSFMWVRDALPHLVQNAKFILYGYDTRLAGSKSFQTVSDIALTFIHTLQQGGWAAPGPRKLIFFAHSLGGIVLKEALRMVADSGVMDELILSRTKGAIFFGVPSQGLDVSDLQIMLQGQPNKDTLIKEISNESSFVEILEEQFSGIAHLRKMKLLWAYETETTPTIAIVDGKYQRSGPGTIFVSPLSATGQRCNFDSGSTIQINANHSDMVKFSQGNELIDRIAYKLQDMLRDDVEKAGEEESDPAIGKTTASRENYRQAQVFRDNVDPAVDPEFWDIHSIIQAIHAPERDNRLEQIDMAAGHSFRWAFEKASVGLTSWLQNDEKLFWISGKPASGKSTFIKYLYQSPLTSEYLRKWYRSANCVRATFFFHHRGTAIQKSLEGLCRGILSQVLEQAPQSFLVIQPSFTQAYQTAVHANKLGSLSLDLQALLDSYMVTPDAEISRQFQKVLRCEMPRKAFRTMVVEPMLFSSATDDVKNLLQKVYLRRDDLLVAYNTDITNESGELFNMKLILSEIGMPWAKSPDFSSLIKDWLEATDIKWQMSIFRDLLADRGRDEPFANVQYDIDKTVKAFKRFSARKALRHRIETANWSLQQLNNAISCVANQQLIDLDLCIFIDALDEHDGPPEFISQFIGEIASAERSKTRMKMLFSSRPWQPFIDAFGHSPGIRIHDFTENDIRELCLQTILPDKPGSAEILQLVEEIVKQARGVFLWVKLVLADLLESAVILIVSRHDTMDLHAALMDVLGSLPNDLEQYYKSIVDRIPYSFRWEAYCLLEVVSKSIEPIYLSQMSDILLCANAKNINEICQLVQRGRQNDAGPYAKAQLRIHSGGLVETTYDDQLQLLHQTLVEFIQLPEFRHLVLGERYRIVKENGHSILSKYKALRDDVRGPDRLANFRVTVDETFLHYAREAESTTGNSIRILFTGTTWQAPPGSKEFPNYLGDASYTTLEVALACGLKLLLEDTMKHDKETRAVLLFPILMHLIELEIFDPDDAIDFLEYVVAQGLQMRATHPGLLILMDYLHNDASPGTMREKTNTIEFCQRAISAFFEPGANLEVGMGASASLINTSSHFTKLMRSHGEGGTVQPLHISSHLGMTENLVEKGADPNGMTSRRLTPLDCWVRRTQDCRSCRYGMWIADVLIRHGGCLNISTRQEWGQALRKINPTPPAGALPFPGWLEGAPGADSDETQASTPRQLRAERWLRNFSRPRKEK